MITQLVRISTRGNSDKLGSTWNPSVVMSLLVHESSPGFPLVQAIDVSIFICLDKRENDDRILAEGELRIMYVIIMRSNEVGHCEGARIL